ncbi:carboxypeptidase-like regulatory domain-containing protein [Hymenobacter latericus]|uniref:carboxypeptidase-like regulatory domain-containing protein n=1 Tax=Hymenobacter sp. YIM 151858-1 TaxID=2987688 RepID=UPI0022266980|nr:carboxypeptidase-like regulatory domain-containing protein [Hymenobacter sp. YIM 151858-1]UYZ58751.1 carboxypeptidase-like regulatory domain-containing protein [Hymenobacter sp. YIM 151858-1]
MNPFYRYPAVWLLGVGLLAAGCGSKRQDPTPPVAATTTSIAGVVQTEDEQLQPLSKAGVLVTLEGTAIRATTDANGAYLLDNVPLGRHVLNLSRPGLGTMRYEANITDLVPRTMPPVLLSEQSSTRVTDLKSVGKTPYSLASEVAAYECTVAYNAQLYPAPKKYAIRLYVGKTADVSNTSYLQATQYSQLADVTSPATPGTGRFRLAFYDNELRQLGFAKGDRVYVAVYGSPKDVQWGGIGREATYFVPYSLDPVTGRIQRVEANLNPNPGRVDFVLP